LRPLGTYEVDLDRYTDDFQVMVAQLVDDEGLSLPGEWNAARIDVVALGPIFEQADKNPIEAAHRLDWDRYTWDAVNVLVQRRLLPRPALDNYDSPATWALIREQLGDDDFAYRAGRVHYIARIAESLLVRDMPPVILVDGVLADGNHRAIGASWALFMTVPVLHLTSEETDR
jgi:hypothetical protein